MNQRHAVVVSAIHRNNAKSRRHALKLNITCSMFEFESSVSRFTKSSPLLVLSLLLVLSPG